MERRVVEPAAVMELEVEELVGAVSVAEGTVEAGGAVAASPVEEKGSEAAERAAVGLDLACQQRREQNGEWGVRSRLAGFQTMTRGMVRVRVLMRGMSARRSTRRRI